MKRQGPTVPNNEFRTGLLSKVILFISLVTACAIILKAFFLQIVANNRWEGLYEAQVITQIQHRPFRLPIVDRHGNRLAITVTQPSIFADPSQIKSPRKVASILSSKLFVSYGRLVKKLKSKRRFVWIKRYVSDRSALQIEKLNLSGVYVLKERKRFYPHKHLAGQVIGFVGWDGHGLEGVERKFEQELLRKTKASRVFRDALGRKLWAGNLEEIENHNVLKLNIDSYIQYVVERELEKACLKYRASSAQAVVMNPWNFEVLAIANWPFFDPNGYRFLSPDQWRNRAITDVFEPGSTFKPFVVAAALEAKIVEPESRFFCEEGSYRVPGHTIRDVHPHGWLSVAEIIKYSSNIGAAKIAQQLGSENFYKFLRKIGFGSRTGIDLPGESPGIVRPWKKWQPVDLATAAFGQGIGVTAMQLTVAFAVIANGGFIGKPSVVAKPPNMSGQLKRIISKETARKLKKMLLMVTEKGGTGTKAAISGYSVAGKTGTAQRINPETGEYSAHGYSSLFVGFVPANHPEIVITIVIHEPHGAIYGGVVAAPVFREIASDVLRYLGIFPNTEGMKS